MPDTQFDQRYPQPGRDDGFEAVRRVVALLLIFSGVAVAVWIILLINKFLSHPEQIAFFNQFIPDNPGMREMEIDGRMVYLPLGVFTLGIYAVGVLLLWVATKILGAFLAGGVRLLQPSLAKFEKRTNRTMGRLQDTMEEIRQNLPKKVP